MSEKESKQNETEETQEATAEKLEIKQEQAPWEKIKLEEEESFIEQYEKPARLGDETKDAIDKILTQYVNAKRVDFAESWFSENEGTIKEKGFKVNQLFLEGEGKGYIMRAVKEAGGFEELEREEKYKDRKREINNIYVLKTSFQQKVVPLEDKFLVLNTLSKFSKKLESELEFQKINADKDETVIALLKNQLDELFAVKQELAEKISGKNFEKDVKKELKFAEKNGYLEDERYLEKIGALGGIKKAAKDRSEYVDKLFPERFNQTEDYGKMSGLKMKRRSLFGIFKKRFEVIGPDGYLQYIFNSKNEAERYIKDNAGEKLKVDLQQEWEEKNLTILMSKPEYTEAFLQKKLDENHEYNKKYNAYRRWFSRKMYVVDSDGAVTDFKNKKEVDKFSIEKGKERQKLKEKISEDLEKEWMERSVAVRESKKTLINNEIASYAKSPEEAIGGIESIYKRAREKLITVFIENDLKKENKTKEELKKIEKEFSGRGVNSREFLNKIIHRKEELENLTGNWGKDKENISNFLENFGFPMKELKLRKGTDEGMNKIMENYKPAVKKQKGFLKWVFELISYTISLEKK